MGNKSRRKELLNGEHRNLHSSTYMKGSQEVKFPILSQRMWRSQRCDSAVRSYVLH